LIYGARVHEHATSNYDKSTLYDWSLGATQNVSRKHLTLERVCHGAEERALCQHRQGEREASLPLPVVVVVALDSG
jgi:hypothetical protein